MPKVTILGAGSRFTRRLITDIVQVPGLENGEFALVDIDAERLGLATSLTNKIIGMTGKRWQVHSSADRREVMAGSDYLINTIEVSGLQAVQLEHEIPLKYGVKQCTGGTICAGGVFTALRTIPTWLEILRDAEQLCPNALVLNYTNPMSMMTLAAVRTSSMPVIGLCHSVPHTSRQLAEYAGVPYEQITWECAGINHMAWFTRLSHHGRDLYPILREKCEDPALFRRDPVRFELMLQMGAFPTESSGHVSDYLPYFRKRQDLIEQYFGQGNLEELEYRDFWAGQTGHAARTWAVDRRERDQIIKRELNGEEPISLDRSVEYASVIIEAVESNRPAKIHGIVPNKGLIPNLPSDGVVEVACMIDRGGFHPCRFGPLPPHLATLCASNMAVFDLTVKAILEGDREAAVHALMLDPLCAAVCSLAEIRQMFDELYEAEKELLPVF